MFLVDLIQHFLHAQACVATPPPNLCTDYMYGCPGTSFTSIGAAFATQGYWVQGDILDYMTFTSFRSWSALLYVVSAIGALIGVALGVPPKAYVWFFMGPALYWWLIATRQDVYGVQWEVGRDQPQDQNEVWKLAEPGLVNTGIAQRRAVWFYSDDRPSQPVNVAIAFLWVDSLISDVVEEMITWLGPYNLLPSMAPDGETNLPTTGDISLEEVDSKTHKWFLMSNLKWEMMENVTSARVHSVNLRNALASFMATECGDQLGISVDQPTFISAAHGSVEGLSQIFKVSATGGGSDREIGILTDNLRAATIPFPDTLKKFLDETESGSSGVGSFGQAVTWGSYLDALKNTDRIRCDTFLDVIVTAFRWESGHAYYQLVRDVPSSLSEENVVYDLFYGWELKNDDGSQLTVDQQIKFLKNLILVHMIKNELATVPQPVNVRKGAGANAENYIQTYQRTVQSKSKFGEVYSWAIMTPYLQGVLLYFLAIAYPFAAMLMLIPGWHKALFTWLSFWAWVKLWDLGFAAVMSLERSIWAMVGNSTIGGADTKVQAAISKVLDIQNSWGYPDVLCTTASGGAACGNSFLTCPIPSVVLKSAAGVTVSMVSGSPSGYSWYDNVKILDRAMLVGSNLNIDLANGYYIFIMAALYFAVPAVTGQLVLGAKSGMASLATSAMQSNAQESGKAVSTAFTSQMTQQLKTASSVVGQEAYAKSMRSGNLAGGALDAGNRALDMGARSSVMSAASNGFGAQRQMVDSQKSLAGAWLQSYGMQMGLSAARKELGGNTAGGLAGGISPLLTGPGGGADKKTAAATRLMESLGTSMQRGASAFAAADQIKKTMADGYGSLALATEAGLKQAELSARGQEAALAQSQQQVEKSGWERAESVRKSEAEYSAQQAKWDAQNNFAQQMAGDMSAMGVYAGVIDPGARPQDMMGMASKGMLGDMAQDAARYSDPETKGGFFDKNAATWGDMKQQFGYGALMGMMSIPSQNDMQKLISDGMGMYHTGAELAATPPAQRGDAHGYFEGAEKYQQTPGSIQSGMTAQTALAGIPAMFGGGR